MCDERELELAVTQTSNKAGAYRKQGRGSVSLGAVNALADAYELPRSK
eukprot:CAMPEP_0197861902 /NCGR_PEP_ID=MMETSP1438-20131217/38247_1 /TAXON_ID=1461541 /ORGANISM="Pterosperma sp., Strain CCMP1384" /LENGTH=47 /DNA_ID= /DNA_START= /DNA_END= /DNA_ORIENTATION=